MKNIKNLKIKTLEGLEVKNLEKFYGPEWGPDSATRAEIYYKGKLAVEVYDAADGGMAEATIDLPKEEQGDLLRVALNFLRRTNTDYIGSGYYADKTVKNFDDDDWLSVVNTILDRYETIKSVSKCFKKNDKYKCVGVVSIIENNGGYSERYLPAIKVLSQQHFRQYMQSYFPNEKIEKITIITPELLSTY